MVKGKEEGEGEEGEVSFETTPLPLPPSQRPASQNHLSTASPSKKPKNPARWKVPKSPPSKKARLDSEVQEEEADPSGSELTEATKEILFPSSQKAPQQLRSFSRRSSTSKTVIFSSRSTTNTISGSTEGSLPSPSSSRTSFKSRRETSMQRSGRRRGE